MDTTCPIPPSSPESRLGLFGTFVSPALEAAFRRRHLPDDRWLCCFLVVAGMLRVMALLVADYFHFGTSSAFWPLLGCRAMFVLLSVWVLLTLRRGDHPAAVDRVFVCWVVVLGVLTVCSVSIRLPANTDRLLLSFAPVVVIYCVTPLPLLTQAALAAAYSGGALLVSRGADAGALSVVALAHGMSNVFGALASWRLNHRRREAYLGTLREADLRAGLEAALAEVRTLRGLLRMCAWCKRVRDEAEKWQPVEAYVQQHTHAEFTHGICPGCMQEQVSELETPGMRG